MLRAAPWFSVTSLFCLHQRVLPSLLQSIFHGYIDILPRHCTHEITGWFFACTKKFYSIEQQPILWTSEINLLHCEYHKQHIQTVLRDSTLRLHIVYYFLKYLVKFKHFYLILTECDVQIVYEILKYYKN